VTAVVGSRVGLRKPGLVGFGPKPKPATRLGWGRRWKQQWGGGEVVGWWCRRGGGGGCVCAFRAREREGWGPKTRNRALMARFRSHPAAKWRGFWWYHSTPLWVSRWWVVRSEMVWQEGLCCSPGTCIPFLSVHLLPTLSILLLSSYFLPGTNGWGWVQPMAPAFSGG